MRLLADCGNTAIKLGLHHQGAVVQHWRIQPSPAAISAVLDAHLAQISGGLLLAGAAQTADVLRGWWAQHLAAAPLAQVGREVALADHGQYAGMGADRIVAGLAAVAQEQRPVIVVDAGTATTFGAWNISAGQARFAGGLIAASAAAMAAGLHALAPALPLVQPGEGLLPANQHSTRGSIAAALGHGHAGLVAACLRELQAATGIATVLGTGGALGPLLGTVLPRACQRPALVLEGLALLAVPR